MNRYLEATKNVGIPLAIGISAGYGISEIKAIADNQTAYFISSTLIEPAVCYLSLITLRFLDHKEKYWQKGKLKAKQLFIKDNGVLGGMGVAFDVVYSVAKPFIEHHFVKEHGPSGASLIADAILYGGELSVTFPLYFRYFCDRKKTKEISDLETTVSTSIVSTSNLEQKANDDYPGPVNS
jgi:hypothetical protein